MLKNTWIDANKYLLIVFAIVMLIVLILLKETIIYYYPTFFNYLPIVREPSSKERELFSLANTLMTQDQKNELIKQVLKEAKMSTYLEIGNCSFKPPIIRTRIHSTLKLKNADTISHQLIFLKKMPIDVAAKDSKELMLNFIKQTPTLYFMYCDDTFEPVGIMIVTE